MPPTAGMSLHYHSDVGSGRTEGTSSERGKGKEREEEGWSLIQFIGIGVDSQLFPHGKHQLRHNSSAYE